MYTYTRLTGIALKNGPTIHEAGHTLALRNQWGQLQLEPLMDENTLKNHEPDADGARQDGINLVKMIIGFVLLLCVAGAGALLLGQLLGWMAGG